MPGRQTQQASERRFRHLLQEIPSVCVYACGPDGTIHFWNRSAETVYGFTAAEAIGRKPADLPVPSAMAEDGERTLLRIFETGQTPAPAEFSFSRKDGSKVDVISNHVLVDAPGQVPEVFCIDIDITAHRRAENQATQELLHNLAFYDPLTQLPNRRLLLDRLTHALTSSARTPRLGAIMFLDLDNFKTLNDTQGHDVGDQLLIEVARRLGASVRQGDTVARLGGDEFVVMLENLDTGGMAAPQTEAVAMKVLKALHRPYRLARPSGQDDHSAIEHHCTASIGITLFGTQGESIDELLKRADLAMYQAKDAGRNTIRFFDAEMQSIVSARASLEADLRQAVEAGQFVLHYQPQAVDEGCMIGVEALLRWQHPQRGLVPPAEFIPLAEEIGLILPLGYWVLETACRQLAAWEDQPELAHLTLSVNVSTRQIYHPDFVDQVLSILARTGANPARLKLELTESLLVRNVEDIIAKMIVLKAKGLGFSLDDFGTGYSSLSYLKRLPLDQLKIDQSFVDDVLHDANDAAIAHMVIALAQSLGLTVVAEGVEQEEQRVFLAGLGCHIYQGYLFSPPLPLEELELFMNRAHICPAAYPSHALKRVPPELH